MPSCEERGESFLLTVADFEGEQAIWFEGVVGLRDEAAVDVEAGFAGEERGGRFVVANLAVEGVAVGFGDVGWVADDGVEGFGFVIESGEKVGLEEPDAVGDVVFAGVGCGDVEGLRGDVEGGDLTAWGRWTARAIAMAPEPVPMSAIFRGWSVGSSFRTASTRCSVSGRGMRTAGVTWRLRP